MQQKVKRVQRELHKLVMTLTSMDLHLNVIIRHFTINQFYHIGMVNHIADFLKNVYYQCKINQLLKFNE